MSEAFIYDAIRTPRGKGKKDGSLHEVKPVNLLAGLLTELQKRNDLDTAAVDDVVMGVVSPIGEQGSVIPKVAALKAGWMTLRDAPVSSPSTRACPWAACSRTTGRLPFISKGSGAPPQPAGQAEPGARRSSCPAA